MCAWYDRLVVLVLQFSYWVDWYLITIILPVGAQQCYKQWEFDRRTGAAVSGNFKFDHRMSAGIRTNAVVVLLSLSIYLTYFPCYLLQTTPGEHQFDHRIRAGTCHLCVSFTIMTLLTQMPFYYKKTDSKNAENNTLTAELVKLRQEISKLTTESQQVLYEIGRFFVISKNLSGVRIHYKKPTGTNSEINILIRELDSQRKEISKLYSELDKRDQEINGLKGNSSEQDRVWFISIITVRIYSILFFSR